MANIFDDLKQNYKTGDVVQKLIFWNVGVSVLFLLVKVFSEGLYKQMFYWLALSDGFFASLIKPWSIMTYSFIHAGIIHLLLNMLVLYFIGQLFYTYFKGKQFLTVYFLGAVFGGLFFLLGASVANVGEFLVGASAAIIAPLIALVTFQPHMQVRLMLVGTVKIWYIAAFIIVLDIIQLSGSNIGGHLAHLGGAFAGFFYIYLLRKGFDLSLVCDNLFKRKEYKAKMSKVYSSKNRKQNSVVKPPIAKYDDTSEVSKQRKIDSILDKISKSGYESLTIEEKKFLFQSGKDL